MTKALIVGDVHIGKGLSMGRAGVGSVFNSRVQDQINLLEFILDTALERDIDNIIFTGDIFEDPKPQPYLIKIFVSWLKALESNSIKAHIIYGNHDILRTGQFVSSVLDIVSEADINGIYLYKDINTINLKGASFTFLPFIDRRTMGLATHEEALNTLRRKVQYESFQIPIENKKVVVGHLAIEGSIYVGDEIDDESNEIFCPVDMFSDYDFVWMGHVHRPQLLSKFPYVAHIGSLDHSGFGENDHDKILVVFDPDLEGNFEHINIPTRPLNKISVEIPSGTLDTTAFVKEQIDSVKTLKKSLVRLEVFYLSPELPPLDRKDIEEYLYSKGVFHISNFSESRKSVSVKKKDLQIDNVVDEMSASKMYADKFVEEKDRESFIKVSFDILQELKATKK